MKIASKMRLLANQRAKRELEERIKDIYERIEQCANDGGFSTMWYGDLTKEHRNKLKADGFALRDGFNCVEIMW